MRLNPTAKIYLECLIAGAKYAAFAYAGFLPLSSSGTSSLDSHALRGKPADESSDYGYLVQREHTLSVALVVG